jgi:hypothetical protein
LHGNLLKYREFIRVAGEGTVNLFVRIAYFIQVVEQLVREVEMAVSDSISDLEQILL